MRIHPAYISIWVCRLYIDKASTSASLLSHRWIDYWKIHNNTTTYTSDELNNGSVTRNVYGGGTDYQHPPLCCTLNPKYSHIWFNMHERQVASQIDRKQLWGRYANIQINPLKMVTRVKKGFVSQSLQAPTQCGIVPNRTTRGEILFSNRLEYIEMRQSRANHLNG